jgi:hypothetical protein
VDIWDVPDAEKAQQPLWCGYRRGLTDKYDLDRWAAAAVTKAATAAAAVRLLYCRTGAVLVAGDGL